MSKTVRWLWAVPGKKKGYVLALALIQAANGSLGVIFAFLLRNIVDHAVSGNRRKRDGPFVPVPLFTPLFSLPMI